MKKLMLIALVGILFSGNSIAQDHSGQRPQQQSSADRAKMTIDRLSETVKFTDKQKSGMTTIFTSFYDDVKAQQAFRDPDKMKPLEKTRDGKVEKLLNDKKLFKQYTDAMAEMKAQWQKHGGHQPPPQQ